MGAATIGNGKGNGFTAYETVARVFAAFSLHFAAGRFCRATAGCGQQSSQAAPPRSGGRIQPRAIAVVVGGGYHRLRRNTAER